MTALSSGLRSEQQVLGQIGRACRRPLLPDFEPQSRQAMWSVQLSRYGYTHGAKRDLKIWKIWFVVCGIAFVAPGPYQPPTVFPLSGEKDLCKQMKPPGTDS